MKRYIKTYLAAIVFISTCLSSCIDLDPVDYSEINPSNFPKSEEDLKALVLSCYYPLRGNWWDGIHSPSERGVMFVNDATTEILTQTWGPAYDCSLLNFFPETEGVTFFYYENKEPYGYANKISRCTLVLDYIEKSSLSDDLKARYSAEVRCARGMLSYILFDMYGPLVVAPIEVLLNPLEEVPLPRLSHGEMVKFIEDDLIFASEHLPYPGAAEYGKFSRGLAKMLLIRLYLHETVNNKDYYTKVETLARELMDSKYGYRLMSDYPAMFELGGQGSANKEIIWAIPSSGEGPSMNQWHMGALPTDFNQNGMGAGWGICTSTWWFYDTFESADTRKTYLLSYYTNAAGEVVDRNTPGSPLATGPIPLKIGYDPAVLGSGGYSDIDVIIYRYADVYLSLAEALIMKPEATSNDYAEALGYVNKIRERAKLKALKLEDVNTQEKFIDQILTERSHEFWCENGQYRADLIRHDKFVQRAIDVAQTPYANKYKELYPLPLSVITDGKGQVKQNPGYDK
ncbi:RagB/SusD family nutrient uptake outer membrane protein [Bacteroides nordii]|uniref:RagB/SusD family nutrient uptake outer membrane protein n=1 Tax=Bacteroides nordii TaxID=291645 RepID=UPI00399B8B0F